MNHPEMERTNLTNARGVWIHYVSGKSQRRSPLLSCAVKLLSFIIELTKCRALLIVCRDTLIHCCGCVLGTVLCQHATKQLRWLSGGRGGGFR